MTVGMGRRAKKITLRFKGNCDVADVTYERDVDGVKQISETPDQWVVIEEGDIYRFFPKENLAYFIVQTEEYELVSTGGIILPETSAEISDAQLKELGNA